MILQLLNAPFPFLDSHRSRWLFATLAGVFVFTFLLVFQPFELHQIQFNKPIFILGYGLITFGVICFALFLLPKLFKTTFQKDQWTVGKTIFFALFQLLFISILNWAYTHYFSCQVEITAATDHSFPYFIFITLSIGIFPCAFLVLFLERKLREEKESKADSINKNISIHKQQSVKEDHQVYKIGTEKQFVASLAHELLCIKSEGNYLELYQWKEDQLLKHVVRLPLKTAKSILEKEKDIHHCHRSYVANFQHLEKVSGNARNYEIQLQNLPFSIPISRSFSKELIDFYL
ncbi:LytTR family DNA-binding domain-containing protein [Flammeovirga sp. EKP202]|uniref:LytTR family DNA-binding domain-containing protein n=1 Tax=Flammeovirga sp. EKP202 TaxID=2770592 RepID=UPI00165FB816|nr:LytTR family DNA-binding domain-containing protein [Flammeovirga sp. EKP202]MBD0400134.1 LytTR family transcriptional regulator [Flammeovirga sp. EKP202]